MRCHSIAIMQSSPCVTFVCRLIVLTRGLRLRVLCDSFRALWGKRILGKRTSQYKFHIQKLQTIKKELLPTVPFASERLFRLLSDNIRVWVVDLQGDGCALAFPCAVCFHLLLSQHFFVNLKLFLRNLSFFLLYPQHNIG